MGPRQATGKSGRAKNTENVHRKNAWIITVYDGGWMSVPSVPENTCLHKTLAWSAKFSATEFAADS